MFACKASERDRWEAHVYPDKHNLLQSENIGTFDSLEDCRSAARDWLSRVDAGTSGDYECGLNCRTQGTLRVCKDTVR